MLKLALFAFRHGWTRTYNILLELDCWLSGLGSASREIARARRNVQRSLHRFERSA